MILNVYKSPTNLQKYWSRSLQRPYVKVKVSRGTQEYPLALRHLAMELFLTVPALLSCSVGVHGHAPWRVPPEYALFHSVNCAHLPGEAFHFLSILSVCHLPNVPRTVSKQPLSHWQRYCWTQLLFFFFVIYRCAQQLRTSSS